MKIRFTKGKQKEFLDKVMERIGCPSLKELINRGVEVSYSSLKNYYCERRLMPLELYKELCGISGFNLNDFDVEQVKDSWGQVLGGKKSKRFK